MNRVTCLNRTLTSEGMAGYRELLVRVVRRKRGNLHRIAFELGVSRRHLYRALMFAGLWPEVVAARSLPPHTASDPLARALQEL